MARGGRVLRFQFELRPLDEVRPWGGERPNLHWFGLTDGWYWIEAEGHEFLRYSAEAVRRWDLERPYPDYYVARVWEDLQVLRWALCEPVPDDLVSFVDGTTPGRELPDDDYYSECVDAAFDVRGDYLLDLGYLTDAPELLCWRRTAEDRDIVTLRQRIASNRRGTFDGPERLDVAVPTNKFFAAVEDFDRRLMSAMEERLAVLERTGPPPGVELDVAHLRIEHTQRSRWLAQRVAAPRQVDWAEVRAGVAEISSWPPRESDND
jgi:hypothetical protein